MSVNPITIIDTIRSLEALLEELNATAFAKPTRPNLYINPILDSSKGPIRTLAIFTLTPSEKLYLISVSTLGADAFTTTPPPENEEKSCREVGSLKDILEQPNIPKIFFNVCGVAVKAFRKYHEIRLDGTIDLKIKEHVSRRSERSTATLRQRFNLVRWFDKYVPIPEGSKEFWRQLEKGKEIDPSSEQEWMALKEALGVSMLPALGVWSAGGISMKRLGHWRRKRRVSDKMEL